MLRTAALPGTSALLSLTIHPRLLAAIRETGTRMRARGIDSGAYLQAIARALWPLQNAGAREAFLQTLRSVIDVRGQRVSADDRLYLLEAIPTLIVWGERDHTIPLAHGRAAHEAMPAQPLSHAARARRTSRTSKTPTASLPRCSSSSPRPSRRRRDALADWGAVLARRSPRTRRPDRALA